MPTGTLSKHLIYKRGYVPVARLTNDLYYAEHLFLQVAWDNYDILYAALSVTHQWQVHAFFQPSKTLTYEELIKHCRAITKQQPSLPHQAGKAHFKMGRIYLAASRYAEGDKDKFLAAITAIVLSLNKHKTGRGKSIGVAAIARPQPDFKLLAEVLVENGMSDTIGL